MSHCKHARIVTPELRYGTWYCLDCSAIGEVLHTKDGITYLTLVREQ